jgi:hypothetical protein
VSLDFILDYVIKKAQENLVGLKLNGTHQLQVYADDVNLLGGTKYMLKSRRQNVVKYNIKMANRSFENMTHSI